MKHVHLPKIRVAASLMISFMLIILDPALPMISMYTNIKSITEGQLMQEADFAISSLHILNKSNSFFDTTHFPIYYLYKSNESYHPSISCSLPKQTVCYRDTEMFWFYKCARTS
jgi:hypothetical protein